MKSLRSIFFVVLGILASLCSPAWAATAVNLNQPIDGAISSVAQSNSYTLSATAGEVLNFSVVSTTSLSGNFGPCIVVYDPNGKEVGSAGGNYVHSVELDGLIPLLTGTYTTLISDCANAATGDYVLFVQKTSSPTGVALPYAAVQTGTITSAAQSNMYNFTANANDFLNFTVVATTSTSGNFGPCIFLYNSSGTPVLDQAGGNYVHNFEMDGYVVKTAGTYNVLVKDCADVATGTYDLFLQKTNAPVNSTPIVYGETQVGTLSAYGQNNAYTLIGTAGEVLDFAVTATTSTSGNFGPCITLYNTTSPTQVDSAGGNYVHNITMNNYQVTTSGTYNVIIKDCADEASGTYNLAVQCIVGACDLPVPQIITISPTSAPKSSPALTLTVNGRGFAHVNAKSVVEWKGPGQTAFAPLTTAFTSTSLLTAVIPAPDLVTVGTAEVEVVTPAPGGGTSNPVPFIINGPTTPPTCSPLPGTYPPPLSVTLADTTAGAVIYYTVNGTTPTTSSTKYTAAIAVAASETIEAIAVAPGFPASAVVSCAYIVEHVAVAPIFSPAAGPYTHEVFVTLSPTTPGSTMYYTTNGTTPTTASNKYTAPIPVYVSETIKAIAAAPGYANSIVSSAAYTIVGAPWALSSAATLIATPDANLNAVVNTQGLAGSYTFQYGTSSTALTTSTPATTLAASTAWINASTKLTTLKTKTIYYYQVVVKTAGGTASGSVLSFTTN